MNCIDGYCHGPDRLIHSLTDSKHVSFADRNAEVAHYMDVMK